MSIDSAIFLFAFFAAAADTRGGNTPDTGEKRVIVPGGSDFLRLRGSFGALAALIASALVNWALGLWAMRGVKAAVVCAAVLNLALLGVCKYLGFFRRGYGPYRGCNSTCLPLWLRPA